MTELCFDSASHTYTVAGRVVPGVTQVIQRAGCGADYSHVPPDVLRRKAALGTAVHAACAEILRGNDEWTHTLLDPWDQEIVENYVHGFRQFLMDTRFIAHGVEVPLHHPGLDYCGTVDAYGLTTTAQLVADWKTSVAVSRAAASLQIAAYAELLAANGIWNRDALRFALQLRSNGTYKVVECGTHGASQVWLACLAEARGEGTAATKELISRWRTEHGG